MDSCTVLEYLLWGILGGDDEDIVLRGKGSSLTLCNKWVPVGPYLEVMTQYLVTWIYVLHDHFLLSIVSVPPLITHLAICIGELFVSLSAFSYPGLPMVPPAVSLLASSLVDDVVFCNLLEIAVVLHVNVPGNLI